MTGRWACPGCSMTEDGAPAGEVIGGEYEGTVPLCEHCWAVHVEDRACGCEACLYADEERKN